ncbi:MAG: DUF1289 domain-containing protein [Pseudomonadota bacterium]
MQTPTITTVESPCIRVCALNADGFCTGCFRSRDEITAWTRLSPEQQEEVVALCRERATDPAFNNC